MPLMHTKYPYPPRRVFWWVSHWAGSVQRSQPLEFEEYETAHLQWLSDSSLLLNYFDKVLPAFSCTAKV